MFSMRAVLILIPTEHEQGILFATFSPTLTFLLVDNSCSNEYEALVLCGFNVYSPAISGVESISERPLAVHIHTSENAYSGSLPIFKSGYLFL